MSGKTKTGKSMTGKIMTGDVVAGKVRTRSRAAPLHSGRK